MPYIKRQDRAQYQDLITQLAALVPQDRMARAGHLNYIVSLLLEKTYGTKIRYADHNEIMGLLTCISLEFYRRKTAPYEDTKIEEDGDLTDL